MSRYHVLLKEYAGHVGLDDVESLVELQEIEIDGHKIGLSHGDGDRGDILYFAKAGSLAEAARTVDVYRFLLIANLFWKGTAGHTIGLQGPTDNLILSGRVPLEGTDGVALARTLHRFAAELRAWSGMLPATPAAPVAPATATGTATPIATGSANMAAAISADTGTTVTDTD